MITYYKYIYILKTYITYIKNIDMLKTYDSIRKIATARDDDYTTGCLPDYPYFKNTIN